MSDMKPEAVQNAEVTDDERAVVRRLVEEVNKWQSAAPHGLDFVMERLARMVKHVDAECAKVQPAEDLPTQRALSVKLIHAYLDKPPVIANLQRVQTKRRKLYKDKKSAELSAQFDTRTMKLISEDWPVWLEQAGLGGFLYSLADLVTIYDEALKSFKEDRDVTPEKLHGIVSFELRQRCGKVPQEMLEALEFLGKEMREAKA